MKVCAIESDLWSFVWNNKHKRTHTYIHTHSQKHMHTYARTRASHTLKHTPVSVSQELSLHLDDRPVRLFDNACICCLQHVSLAIHRLPLSQDAATSIVLSAPLDGLHGPLYNVILFLPVSNCVIGSLTLHPAHTCLRLCCSSDQAKGYFELLVRCTAVTWLCTGCCSAVSLPALSPLSMCPNSQKVVRSEVEPTPTIF